jgi:hypothetical protein
MKIRYAGLLLLFCSISLFSTAKEAAQPFDYDENQMTQEFEKLNRIEEFVSKNKGLDIKELEKVNPQLFSDIEIRTEAAMVFDTKDELPLGVPSFWWGCCLGGLGILLVYIFSDEDKEQTKKAFYGCLVSGATAAVLYLGYFLFLATTAASVTY